MAHPSRPARNPPAGATTRGPGGLHGSQIENETREPRAQRRQDRRGAATIRSAEALEVEARRSAQNEVEVCRGAQGEIEIRRRTEAEGQGPARRKIDREARRESEAEAGLEGEGEIRRTQSEDKGEA